MKIKLVSLNIWQGAALDDVCAFLEAEQPDIVTLQEVYNGEDPALAPELRSLQTLKERLTFLPHSEYEAALSEKLPDGNIPEGNAILSRFPITARDAVFFNQPFAEGYIANHDDSSDMPHVLLHAELNAPVGPVNVFCLHGPWDLDGDNFSDHRKQMAEAVIAGAEGKPNVIVAGDTNARPTNQAIKLIDEHLTNVFGHSLTTTFNMRRKTNPGYATSVVDIAFVSPTIKVLSKDCPDVDISDHLPLVVTLEIPER